MPSIMSALRLATFPVDSASRRIGAVPGLLTWRLSAGPVPSFVTLSSGVEPVPLRTVTIVDRVDYAQIEHATHAIAGEYGGCGDEQQPCCRRYHAQLNTPSHFDLRALLSRINGAAEQLERRISKAARSSCYRRSTKGISTSTIHAFNLNAHGTELLTATVKSSDTTTSADEA